MVNLQNCSESRSLPGTEDAFTGELLQGKPNNIYHGQDYNGQDVATNSENALCNEKKITTTFQDNTSMLLH